MPVSRVTLYSDKATGDSWFCTSRLYLYALLGHLTFSPAHQSFVVGQQ